MRDFIVHHKTLVIITCVLILISIFAVIFRPRVHFHDVSSGDLSFSALPPQFPLNKNGHQQIIKKQLSAKEVSQLATIVSGKTLRRDDPSCGFSANTAFTLYDAHGAHVFCIAQDGDGILKDESTGLYLYLSDKETEEVTTLFSRYGGKPPYGI